MRSTFSLSPDKLARTQGSISHIIQQPCEWILSSLWQNVNCFSLTLLLTDLLIISAVYSAQALCYQFLHYSDSQQTRPIRAQHNSCPRQELCETTNRLGIKSRCIRTALSFSAKLLVWRHSLLYIVFPLYSTLIDFVLKCVRRVLKPEVASRPFFFFFLPFYIFFHLFCLSPYIARLAHIHKTTLQSCKDIQELVEGTDFTIRNLTTRFGQYKICYSLICTGPQI